MAQAFLERTFGLASLRPTLTRSESVESSTTVTTATSSSQNRLSHSSTPPTSAADSESVASSLPKDIDGTTDRAGGEAISDTESRIATPTLLTSHSRPRRSRASVVETYNVKILSGTSVRASKKLRTEAESPNCTPARQRTIGTTATALRRATPCDATGNGQFDAVSTHSSPRQAVQVQRSNEVPPKGQSKSDGPGRKKSVGSKKHEIEAGHDAGRATRSAGGVAENLVNRLTVLGKRGRDKFEANLVKAKRELMRLADTNEFAKVETKPVVTEVWSKGKLVTGDEPPKKKVKTEIPVVIQVWSNGKLVTGDEPPKKKVKTENVSPVKGREEDASTKPTQPKKNGPKVWLNKGLYAGQDVRALDWFAGLPKLERKRKAVVDPPKPNKILPMPMWHGQRLLHTGRDFKLPFDICSPLPPGQPKPDEWRKVPKSK
jgi:histone-lysine N-methyltransferase ASH1L